MEGGHFNIFSYLQNKLGVEVGHVPYSTPAKMYTLNSVVISSKEFSICIFNFTLYSFSTMIKFKAINKNLTRGDSLLNDNF